MKNRIKLIFWAIALVIYTASAVRAQVVKNPENPFNPIPTGTDSNLNNVLVAQFGLKGNESNYENELLHLQIAKVELPLGLIPKTGIKKMSLTYETYSDTSIAYADIDLYGNVTFNLDITLYRSFKNVKVHILGLNPKDLTLGDTFEIKISLGIDLDGVTPSEYLKVDPQFLFYGKKEIATTGIHSLNKPIVSIYPNPFLDVINVDLPKTENIVIINKLGQKVYTGSSNDPIETTNFPSGEYFIKTSYGFNKVIK